MRQAEVMPLVGLGRIRFGQTPAQVRRIMNEPEIYQDWMGATVDFGLTYSGVLFGFDDYTRSGPTRSARLQEIYVHRRPRVALFGRPLQDWSRAALIDELTEQRLEWSSRPELDVAIESLSLEVSFDADRAYFVAFWEPQLMEAAGTERRPWWQLW